MRIEAEPGETVYAHYGELDGDDEHYIYEAVMEAYYGTDI